MNNNTKIMLAIVVTAVVTFASASMYFQNASSPVLTGVARIQAEGKLVVGLDVYPPWADLDEGDQWIGFDVEVLENVAEELGVEFEGKAVIWESIIPSLLSKDIDVIASALSITPARSEEVLYSISYYEVTLAFVVRAGEVDQYYAANDFIGKNVGAQAGTTGWDLAQLLYTDSTTISDFPSTPDLLLALEGGIIDVAIFDTPTARYYADLEPTKFAVTFTHPTHGYPDYYAYAVRPEDGDLAKVINTVIVQMMESGELYTLMDTWGVSP
jgi:polar amino acid transport system substrate-binding protein